MRKILVATFCLFLFTVTFIFAGTTGKISGRVVDSSTGEPLVGVNIVVEGTTIGAAAAQDGNYVILNISPGKYSVKATMIGYSPLRYTDVRVNIDITTTLDFELKIESIVGEEVVVVAERKVIKKDVASSQINIPAERIDDLPVSSIEEVISMQAGVDGLSVRRGGEDELALMVDGIALKDERTGKPITGIPLNSVQEIMIQSGGFNAEYSDLQAGVINIVTKEGSLQKYVFNINLKYSPPAPKHFGMSIYDKDSYYMRPWLDDKVCWTGTDNGAWDKHMQARFPSFQGWNAVSHELLTDNDPTNDLSPSGAQKLFMWEHRKDGNIRKPDYYIDGGFGGPIPVVSTMLGNLRFYSSFQSTRNMYLVPFVRDSHLEWVLNTKITSDITDKIKLQFSHFYKEQRTVCSSGTGGASFFKDSIWDVAGVFRSYSQQRSKIFYPEYYCASDISDRMISAKISHFFNPKSFYEGVIEYATTEYSTNPGQERDNSLSNDIFPGVGEFFVDEAPWGFETLLASKSIDGFMMGAKSNSRDSTVTSRFRARFDLTAQLNRFHQFKFGFLLNYYDYKMNYGAKNPDLPVGRPFSKWERDPYQIAVYMQDKMEFHGWIATLGLRAEYFDPHTNWYIVDEYNKSLFSSMYNPDAEGDIPISKAKGRLTLLPRLGISHPITVNSKLYFNYGHQRQKFLPDELFGTRRVTGGQMSRFGDPELPMEKTIAYELGYDQSLFDQYLIHAAAYYKDKSDQSGLISYKSADNTVGYSRYSNNFYQDVRGLELEIRKRAGDWLTGFINYTYAVYTSGRFGVRNQYENPSMQREYELDVSTQVQYKPIPRPSVKYNIAFHSPRYGKSSLVKTIIFDRWDISFTGHWNAGSYATFGNVYGVTNNVRWKDSYNVTLKISKTVHYKNIYLTFLTEIFNVFNFKHLSMTGLGDPYLTPEIYQQYTESLHFPKKVYDELGEKYIYGDDKLGDYRPLNVDFQAMDYIYQINQNFTGDASVIYYADLIALESLDLESINTDDYTIENGVIIDFNNYVQLNEEGKYERVSKKEVDKILDDKAYIFNPANESFMFLAPRDIFFGIKLSFEL